MKTITSNGMVYNYKYTDQVKYLERVERNGAILYYRCRREDKGLYVKEYLPQNRQDEFELVWKYEMKKEV